jgi:hypothetical protein
LEPSAGRRVLKGFQAVSKAVRTLPETSFGRRQVVERWSRRSWLLASRWSWLKTLGAGKGQERIHIRFAAKT